MHADGVTIRSIRMLRAVGVPVSDGRAADSADAVWEAARSSR
jgi:hypothetical protein